tara:strand:+ start:27262 stop:27756 length:495 start_codon:yes stop_codon:yes gene_type:complete
MDLSCLENLPLIEKAPGEEIFVQGQQCPSLFLLEEGCVEILKNGVYITEISEKGACFGEMSYLLQSEDTATVRVKEPSTFRWIEDLSVHLEANPGFLVFLARSLAHRLNAVNEYLAEIKRQYGGKENHFDLMDDILKALLVRNPPVVPPREVPDDSDPPIPGSR